MRMQMTLTITHVRFARDPGRDNMYQKNRNMKDLFKTQAYSNSGDNADNFMDFRRIKHPTNDQSNLNFQESNDFSVDRDPYKTNQDTPAFYNPRDIRSTSY